MAGDLHSYSRTEAPYFSVNYSPSERSPYRPDLVRHRLLVDNRDRYDAANTSPFDFRIDFRDTGIERLENVTSVELTSLTVPQVDTDPYVILDSFELGEHMLSSSSSAHQTYNVGIFRGDLKAGNVVTLQAAPGSNGAARPAPVISFLSDTAFRVRFNPSGKFGPDASYAVVNQQLGPLNLSVNHSI